MSTNLKERYTDTIFEDMRKISCISDLLSFKDAQDWKFNYIERALKLVPNILKYIIAQDTVYLIVDNDTKKYGITFRLNNKEEIETGLCIVYHDDDVLLYPITRNPTLMEVRTIDDLDVRHMLISRAKKIYPSLRPENLTLIVDTTKSTLLCRVTDAVHSYECTVNLN